MQEKIKHIIDKKLQNQQGLTHQNLRDQINNATLQIIKALKAGKKILVCGNGGSAADAQHFVAELVVRFQRDRRPLPALALHTNTSVLTATANDYDFTQVFSRQVEALGEKGDVLIGISTSGESANILEAFAVARKKGITTIGLTGARANQLSGNSDYPIQAPGDNTAEIQECHIIILHTICQLIEEELFQ